MIYALIDNGTYKTKYKIGNYKPLDLGTEGTINMQIVAMDADELASGGYAPLTFVGMELLATSRKHRGNNTNSGGWPLGGILRNYIDKTLPSLMPSNVYAKVPKRGQNLLCH